MNALEILGLSIKRLQHSSHCALNARLAPAGISLVQWNALREIKRHPGLSMHRLAERTFNSDQAFGTLMARLRRQKLVERQPGAGRANLHRLTARGETLLADGHRIIRGTLGKIFSPLSADEQVLMQTLLNKVIGDHADVLLCGAPLLAGFAKTLVGLAPNPKQPAVRDGVPPSKPASRRTGKAR